MNTDQTRRDETLHLAQQIIRMRTKGHSPRETNRLLRIDKYQACYALRALKKAWGGTYEHCVACVALNREGL